jgi:di/tricarboxylate transporter
MPNPRWIVAGAFLLLSIGVDFSSRLLSMASDALIIGVAVFVLLPMVKSKK